MAITGTCIWWGPEVPWGFIGFGIFTNNTYENQIYTHYKNLKCTGQRNPKFVELKSGDICQFKISEGYRNVGTQAVEVELMKRVEDNYNSGGADQSHWEDKE